MAVPGSPRSRASAGTNQLLVDGVAPVTSVDDVLVALGLDHRRQGTLPFDARPMPDQLQRRVLDVCATGDTLVEALRRTYAAAAAISWPSKVLRRDIGRRVLERQAD